jgi:hypothetical protein
MSFMRGKDSHQSNASVYEDVLMRLCHRAVYQGYLLERPITEEWIPLHKSYSWNDNRPARSKPDQLYPRLARATVFVDGPHHRKGVHPQRDYDIRSRLLELKWFVLAIKTEEYTTPLRALREMIIPNINARITRLYPKTFAKADPDRFKVRMTKKTYRMILECDVCGTEITELICTSNVCRACCQANKCPTVSWCAAKQRGLV